MEPGSPSLLHANQRRLSICAASSGGGGEWTEEPRSLSCSGGGGGRRGRKVALGRRRFSERGWGGVSRGFAVWNKRGRARGEEETARAGLCSVAES